MPPLTNTKSFIESVPVTGFCGKRARERAGTMANVDGAWGGARGH